MPAFLPSRPSKEALGRPGLTTVYVILMVVSSFIFFETIFSIVNPELHPNLILTSMLATVVFLGVSVCVKNFITLT